MEQGKDGEIYNIAGDEVLTIRQIVENIAIATNSTIPELTLPLFPTKVAAWKLEKTFRLFKKEAPLSIQKAAHELGFVP